MLVVIVLTVLGSHKDIFEGSCKDPRIDLVYSDISDFV